MLTLPFWRDGFADVRLVGTYRHPLQVARSLHARGGMAYAQAFELWRQYNARLLDYRRHDHFPIVSFDLPDADYRAAVARIARTLGLDPGPAPTGDAFFDAGLRTVDPPMDGPPMPPAVAALLERLRQEAWP